MIDHDALTGAFSRNAFNTRLAETINEADNHGSGFALLYVDIDNMKHFNAHNGHLAGDQMLKSFVKLIQPVLENVRRQIRRERPCQDLTGFPGSVTPCLRS